MPVKTVDWRSTILICLKGNKDLTKRNALHFFPQVTAKSPMKCDFRLAVRRGQKQTQSTIFAKKFCKSVPISAVFAQDSSCLLLVNFALLRDDKTNHKKLFSHCFLLECDDGVAFKKSLIFRLSNKKIFIKNVLQKTKTMLKS